MSDYNNSPNMSLPIPIPSYTSPPAWANYEVTCFTTLDAHTHQPGSGVPITPAAININGNLTFNSLYSVTNLLTTSYTSQSAALSTTTYPRSLYTVGGELYWNDGASHQVKITSSGTVNATSSGLTDGANIAQFTSNILTVTNIGSGNGVPIDAAAYILRYPGSVPAPSGNAVLLQAPASVSGVVPIIFPGSSAGASNSFLVANTSGQLSYVTPDNATLIVNSGVLKIGTLASQSVTQGELAARPTGSSAGNIAISSSCGNFTTTNSTPTAVTNLSVTLTTTGRPVMLMLQDDGLSNGSQINISPFGVSPFHLGTFCFYRGGTQLSTYQLENYVSNIYAPSPSSVPASSLVHLDVVTAGTYTYTLQVFGVAGFPSNTTTVGVANSVLVAYEI
jgi:hypothetical protein